MNDKPEVWQGTLSLMVLKTLERGSALHGYELTRAGRKQIQKETRKWEQMTVIVAGLLNPGECLA
jgi:hypothetical protein